MRYNKPYGMSDEQWEEALADHYDQLRDGHDPDAPDPKEQEEFEREHAPGRC